MHAHVHNAELLEPLVLVLISFPSIIAWFCYYIFVAILAAWPRFVQGLGRTILYHHHHPEGVV